MDMKLKPEIKELWTTELRREHQQVSGALCIGDGYCCLGLLVSTLAQRGELDSEYAWHYDSDANRGFVARPSDRETQDEVLFLELWEQMWVDSEAPSQQAFSCRNDGNSHLVYGGSPLEYKPDDHGVGMSFSEIADWIEGTF